MPSKTRRRGQGDGGLYQRASDGMWCAVVELPPGPDGKRRRKTVTARDRAAAASKLKELRRDLDRAGDLPTSSPTLEQWLRTWMEKIVASRVRPRTLDGYQRDINRFVIPAIGRIRLDKLTAAHVRRMHEQIIATNSPTTALRCHRTVAVALRDAMREGKVTRNVATSDFMDAPRPAVYEPDLLTVEQTVNVLRVAMADDQYGARWATTLLTGARRGEVLGVEADRVNLADGTLTLSWQLQRLLYSHGCGGTCGRKRGAECPARFFQVPAEYEKRQVQGGLHLVRPKSKAGWRVVPLVPVLAATLTRQVARRPEGLLFTEPGGSPIDPRDDGPRWHQLLRAAGVPDDVKVRQHDARHFAATLLMASGVDTHVIAQILGHASVLTTRRYQHVDLTLARAAMGRFAAALEV